MPDEPDGRRPAHHTGGWQEGFRDAGPYLGLGMQLALTMVLFTIGGYLLDGWLDTTPWLTITGAVVGMTAIFIHLFRVSKSMPAPKKVRHAAGVDEPGAWKEELQAPSAPGAGAYRSPVPGPSRGEKSAPAVEGSFKGLGQEEFSELERGFARLGTIQEGKLLLPAWDAVGLVGQARKERVPILAVGTFVPTEQGLRHIETFNLSGGAARDGWDEAERFIEDLRDSGLQFQVELGEAD